MILKTSIALVPIFLFLAYGCQANHQESFSGKVNSQGPSPNLSPSSVPIAFSAAQILDTPLNPTRLAWGPDGKLYAAMLDGLIHSYTLDENDQVTHVQVIQNISQLSNRNILGIAFNPFDPPDPPRIYVAHSQMYANQGDCFSGQFSPYSGQVSTLEGPDFSQVRPLITGLPVSNHDHGINGLEFDGEGNLLIAVGGTTNAGVPSCKMGGLPESPFSAAVLKAPIGNKDFRGEITYVETATGTPNQDQVFGDRVDVAPGGSVFVHSAGLRNPFDLLMTTTGELLGTDNGADPTYGAQSISATQEGPDPDDPDEILHLVQGHYYGHPNRNRGRAQDRQNTYRRPEVSTILGIFTAPLATLPSSSNAIEEYRANTFGGQLRGNLLIQSFGHELWRLQQQQSDLRFSRIRLLLDTTGLDIIAGPGGSILVTEIFGNAIKIYQPIDNSPQAMIAYDVFPWRGQENVPFVIGGRGFGNLGNTTVHFDGIPALLTSVSSKRIQGRVPYHGQLTADLIDIDVQSNGLVSHLPQAFRYLLPAGAGQGKWHARANVPLPLVEVSTAVVNGILYLVGESHETSATLAYDIAADRWFDDLAVRPFVGDHHGAESIDEKLYLFGGLKGSSEGKIQIYHPLTNSWSQGAPIPVVSGAAATAVVDGLVYYFGGVAGGQAIPDAAVYDPQADTWHLISPMPFARHHTASATDGRRIYIFGGREGPNFPAPGSDHVQIYDPFNDTWETNLDPGSGIPAMPEARSGFGKAVYFQGEFYVMGGETTRTGEGIVDGVLARVDVYNPVTQTWREEAHMPTGRHGIFPVSWDGKIYVAAGDVVMGHGIPSLALEVFSR